MGGALVYHANTDSRQVTALQEVCLRADSDNDP